MADVFISYSKSHIQFTRSLATELEAKGLTVWWDTDILAGESFRDRIIEELKLCKVAIIIWTRDSVRSSYVLSEAERARIAGKLIQLRTADLKPSELPPPFDTIHASLTDDYEAMYRALAKFGLLPGGAVALGSQLLSYEKAPHAFRWLTVRTVAAPALGVLMVIGVLTNGMLDRAAPSKEKQAIEVAKQFFDDLNTGLHDSSRFDSDVRLGRRGLMPKIEVVNELRKLSQIYNRINCRVDSSSPPMLKNTEVANSGFRAKIFVDCDFTDKSDMVTTRRFPFEIEVTAGTSLISGLWHSDEMVLWQPRRRD